MARKIGFSKVPWLGVLAGLLGYFFHATMLSGGSAELMAGESVTYALRDGETVTVRPLWPRVAFSAGTPGEPAGEGGVFLGTRCIARIPLLWGECTDEGTNSEDPFCARRCLAARS